MITILIVLALVALLIAIFIFTKLNNDNELPEFIKEETAITFLLISAVLIIGALLLSTSPILFTIYISLIGWFVLYNRKK